MLALLRVRGVEAVRRRLRMLANAVTAESFTTSGP
jgi:hypothetical protein